MASASISLDQQALERGRVVQQLLQANLLFALAGQFLLDLDPFQAGQLAQAHFQDVVGLALGQLEALHQRGARLVGFADGLDDFVHVQVDHHPAFQHVDAVDDLVQAEARAARHGLRAERQPFSQDVAQALLARTAVGADADQVDRGAAFHAGLRQQRVDEFIAVHARGLGLEHQAHGGVLAGLVAHGVQQVQHDGLGLGLLGRQALLAGLDLGIGDFLDLFEHLLAGRSRRQLGHHQLPLAARHFLELPARAHLERAATGRIDLGDIGGRRDDLAAAGEVEAGHQAVQLGVGQLRLLDQRHAGLRHFTQIVRRDFGGHAHGDAGRAVQQHHRQARRQHLRLFLAAVVVGHEIDRALVQLVQQQLGDRRERASV